jgi:hypothetical protein
MVMLLPCECFVNNDGTFSFLSVGRPSNHRPISMDDYGSNLLCPYGTRWIQLPHGDIHLPGSGGAHVHCGLPWLLWSIQGVTLYACVGMCITERFCLSVFLSTTEFWWYLVSGVYTNLWWTDFIFISHWYNISAALPEARNQICAKISKTVHQTKTCM